MAEIILIAAKTRNHVIGKAGEMPWHLPADLKHFKAITTGYPIIMGRKTYDTLGKALPDRKIMSLAVKSPNIQMLMHTLLYKPRLTPVKTQKKFSLLVADRFIKKPCQW